MKYSPKGLIIGILLPAALLVGVLALWGCGSGSYHGYSSYHGPAYPHRSAWDYDRYYRRRVNRFYNQNRGRREAIRQRRSVSGRGGRVRGR